MQTLADVCMAGICFLISIFILAYLAHFSLAIISIDDIIASERWFEIDFLIAFCLLQKGMVTNMDYFLGIDIGGTKTAVALYERRFHPVRSITMPTSSGLGCHALTRRIGEAARTLLREEGIAAEAVQAAGVACPGPLDLGRGSIVYIPTMDFRNEPLVAMLEESLEMPVTLENDTNAAALCESVFGQGQNADTVVYITVSTGIGCGIVCNRKIVDGAVYAAGELGHFKVTRGGPACPCGGRGCLEAYSSGTAVARIASERYGRELDTKEVYALARRGDPLARTVVREAAEHLGYAIAAIYQLMDPGIVVLGGSVTKDYDVFHGVLLESIEEYIQKIPGREIRIAVSGFDGGQVALGAAWYAAQRGGLVSV
jgi:glucokinase